MATGIFQTTEVYLSGGICGPIWWPFGAVCGISTRVDLRRERERFVGGAASLREVLDHVLMENGGDFQHAQFTADTRLVIVRKRIDGPGKYAVHVREREIGELAQLADLVNAEAYTGDFMGED